MEAKELRIENYVIGYDNKVFTWELIDFDTLYNDVDVSEMCKPVPLTEEWLYKFGFSFDKYGEYRKGRYTLDCEYTDKGVYNFVIDNTTCIEVDVKYVHQLQNLYFSLTGEELIINND